MANNFLSTAGEVQLFVNFEGPNLGVPVPEVEPEDGQEFSALSSKRKPHMHPTNNKYSLGKSLYNICTICGDSFEDCLVLEKHFAMHINEAPFECPFCANLFEALEAFSDHIVTHTTKKKLLEELDEQSNLQKCEVPLKQLEDPDSDHLLEEEFCDAPDLVESPQSLHQDRKLGPLPWQTKDKKFRPYNCTECDRSFTLASSLAVHNRRKHLLIKPYECSICNSAFVQSNDLRKHQRTHTGEKPYRCEECGAYFTQRRNLRNHQKMHLNSKHKCSYCGLGLQHEVSLIKHIRMHEGANSHICAICSIPYVNQNDLDSHVKRAHEVASSDVVCLVCDKSFNSRSELSQHSIKHTGEKPYICDTCGKSFAHRTSLINHRVVHTGKKIYQCTYCGQAFGFSGNLKAHTRIHTGERPFECEICHKTFTRSANLKEHLKTHTGERPIRCDLCGKTFTSSSGCVKHRKIHTGERPHKCNICSKTFVQMVHLNKHILTHTGEKPHQCEVCQKFYRRKDTLAKHLQSHEIKEPLSSGEQDAVHVIGIEIIDLQQ